MTERGEQAMKELANDLACPRCDYNLRGLVGDEVVCPECGQHVNVARLIAQRWTRPWWHAPLYNTLALPLAWVVLSAIALLPITAISLEPKYRHTWIPWAFTSVAVVGWFAVMAFVRRRFGSSEGIALALLLHAVLPAYLFGLFGVLSFGIRLIAFDIGRFPAAMAIIDAVSMAAGVVVILVARFTERFIARRCIKRHLQQMASSSR